VSHGLYLSGSIDDLQGENQGQRNDVANAIMSGAVRSKKSIVDGLSVATSLDEERSEGDRALGLTTSPSTADGDSLGGGVFFQRGNWESSFRVRQSNYNRRYLDYRRNSNGIIDTFQVAQKIVEELERQDALSLEWVNEYYYRRVGIKTALARDVDEQDYRVSGVGLKENHQDEVVVNLSFRYSSKDSVTFRHKYLWKWDDQTYKGATVSRGRQISQRREFDMTVQQRVFAHTNATVKYSAGLTQDFAENQFNDNDRDRYVVDSSVKLATDWSGKFRTSMSLSYNHVEDISIRQSRSANNNEKDTYEIVPGYFWPLAGWLDLQQDFRISIQFTNYVFSGYPGVSRQDDYNKRGNLNTRVTLRPNPRLSCTISHDYSAKFNASRTRTDVTGTDFYARDLEQRISTIDLALTYRATEWFKLEGASYRTKDLKDTFGVSPNTRDTRSGEIWLGAVVNKTWGSTRNKVLAATVRRYYANGPNVQESNAQYWDADMSFRWKF